VIASTENLGFAAGNNLGLARARGRSVLLLNPDTLVPEGALRASLDFLDARPAATGAMTCRVESSDGSLQWHCARRLITPWILFCRVTLLERAFSRSDLFNREPFVRWDKSDARPVPAALGAFLLIRREALERVGGLDERYFLMYEDVDWCRRLGAAGYELWYWPGARIVHLGGGSWKQDPVTTYADGYISGIQYMQKHHPRSVPWLRAALLLGVEWMVLLLRLALLLRPGSAYARTRLEMARAARRTLRTGRSPREERAAAPAAGTPGEVRP